MSRVVQVTLESSVIFHSVWKTMMVQMSRWKVQPKKIPQVLLFLQVGHVFSWFWCGGGQAKC